LLELYRLQNPTIGDKLFRLLLRRLIRVRSAFQKAVASASPEK
jgi:hypothetical protein